eukprot:Tamp_23775.p1 GENE.Tamp_23775~~Tamp_23775.p1  ORF type:complete len:211 (-),score=29.86 Tamp_23775:387-932(-)
MKMLSDNTDYTVIAVLGLAGAGKSSVMNELASMTSAWGGVSRGLPRKPFAVQTEDILLDASHQTVGVDMHVTEERVILLDCQPVLSSSVVLDMILEGDTCETTYEHAMLTQSYKLAMFVLSVCHVVMVVSNDPVNAPDRHLLALLRSAQVCLCVKRDLFVWQKRPKNIRKYLRSAQVSKET